MFPKRVQYLQQYFSLTLPLLLTFYLVRAYESIFIASKVFVDHPLKYEIQGLFYDTWLWFIYTSILLVPFFILYHFLKSAGKTFIIGSSILFLFTYLALLVVFTERNTPFDHEFFTRSAKDSIETSKQMLTSSLKVYVPFILYTCIYILSLKLFRKFRPLAGISYCAVCVGIISIGFVSHANPSPSSFKSKVAYYLVCNKFSYWISDSYNYFNSKQVSNFNFGDRQLELEVNYYQFQHPYQFTSKEYPLLHTNNSKDVLGPFFNLSKNPPNIVILVVEGLSRDFSGQHAYAGSFTPFLDSLSEHSLTWNNFLSTAPGTFAAHPAISGSLPYGDKGFSMLNVMPDHLSLIKILRANGYQANFMIGFNPDFDNMGGYIRLQGTDFILSHYGSKYKEMGVGSEGWSMGYPDDALFQRSFEVLDSLKKVPYLSIYHTATTHMPYLFEQKGIYEHLFDKKIRTMAVTPSIKKTLRETKSVLTTFMFSDDCLRKFFCDYSKRPEYSNTIFFITGDHHIGSFPSTGEVDDYHVPFIIYSPMLKKPNRFLSVNSHNNITPSILSLLFNNYTLPVKPKSVSWLGDVVDTCSSFRNIQSMAFMSWSREINDYIYKDYFVSGDQLYKLTPELLQVDYDNDSLKHTIQKLRENFKIINKYVCVNNKIFPASESLHQGEMVLLKEFSDPTAKKIYNDLNEAILMPLFEIPKTYKKLYVEVKANVNLPSPQPDYHPTIRLALVDDERTSKNYLYWSKRELVSLSKNEFVPRQWNSISTTDMFTLDEYKNIRNLKFETAIFTDSTPINFKMENMDIKIYGVK
ncbi:MAG: LTA synthase family protein [Candidatus Dadabacteria bacterium]